MSKRLTDKAAFEGETLTGTFTAPAGATAVVVSISDGMTSVSVNAASNDDGTWAVTANASTLAGISGATRWVALATTPDGVEEIGNGSIYIKPLISKYRAIITAIEDALQNYAANPNKSISVGELSITYKDRADLLDILAYWRRRAEADENGIVPSSGGVQFVKVRF